MLELQLPKIRLLFLILLASPLSGCGDRATLSPLSQRQQTTPGHGFEDQSFHDIIRSGGDRIERTKRLIANGGDLNERRGGATPAMTAVTWGGQYEIALLLLEAGADTDAYTHDGLGRISHLMLGEKGRLSRASPERKLAYARLITWLEDHGEDFAEVQADRDRWRSWNHLSSKEYGKKRRQEIAERMAREAAERGEPLPDSQRSE